MDRHHKSALGLETLIAVQYSTYSTTNAAQVGQQTAPSRIGVATVTHRRNIGMFKVILNLSSRCHESHQAARPRANQASYWTLRWT